MVGMVGMVGMEMGGLILARHHTKYHPPINIPIPRARVSPPRIRGLHFTLLTDHSPLLKSIVNMSWWKGVLGAQSARPIGQVLDRILPVRGPDVFIEPAG